MHRTGPTTHDRGETLIELLVAVLIIGTAVVAVVGGLGTAIMLSDIHRKQAGVAEHMKIYAANIEGAIAASPTQYVDFCATPSYPNYTAAGYNGTVTEVRYWNGSAFVTSCAPGDTGVQRLTLRVRSTDGRAEQTMDLIIRKPCRPTDSLCS
jgi:Tfp pilus assembly protein PilV